MGMYSHGIKLEALNFGYKQKGNCTIRVAKTKALISSALTEIIGFLVAAAHFDEQIK